MPIDKAIGQLMFVIVCILTLTQVKSNAQISYRELPGMVVKDETFVVPGIGASSIVIDMPEDEVLLIKGKPFEKTQNVMHDFFNDVLKINSTLHLPFNYLFTYNSPSVIIGFYKEKVSFIVAWGSGGVLIDGIPLSRGIMAIVFHYGNDGMQIIHGSDGIILVYPTKGIAFIDEKNDDIIDGIIIFKSGVHLK